MPPLTNRTLAQSSVKLEDLVVYLKSDFMNLKDFFYSVYQILIWGRIYLFFKRQWFKFVVYNSVSYINIKRTIVYFVKSFKLYRNECFLFLDG